MASHSHALPRALSGIGSVPAVRSLAGILAFALLVSLGARFGLPVAFSPVPLTLQVPFVLLAGVVLGPRRGAASMAAYLGAGMAGLPVFAGGGGFAHLLGPTGGYLVGFLPAAATAGALAGRRTGSFLRLAGAMAAGLGILYLMGALHVALLLGAGPQEALRAGVVPFLAADLVKVTAGAALVAAWRGRRGRRPVDSRGR